MISFALVSACEVLRAIDGSVTTPRTKVINTQIVAECPPTLNYKQKSREDYMVK